MSTSLGSSPVVYRFKEFELDLRTYELRRSGCAVRLERRPMDLLVLLVEHAGALVTRGEIVERLWGPGVFVDAETGVNTAVSKLRQALRDPADAPTCVETVQGRGYRFIAPIGIIPPLTVGPPVGLSSVAPDITGPPVAARTVRRKHLTLRVSAPIITHSGREHAASPAVQSPYGHGFAHGLHEYPALAAPAEIDDTHDTWFF